MRGTESVKYYYYNDMGKDRGHCSWGIGILAHHGVCTQEELGKEVSKAEVEAEFSRRIAEAERGVHRNITVELTQEQFDGLVSFTFNTGAEGASDTYALINKNDFAGAAANMQQFVRVRVKTKGGTKKVIAKGLVKRRAEESAPFLNANN
jgi:GH24 family phage-related lysozyme (muramidase)